MHIGFCGDSYCQSQFPDNLPNHAWPNLVAEHISADIVFDGMGGHPLFHSYQVLLQSIDVVDCVIFCITDPYRLPNKHYMPITVSQNWIDAVVTPDNHWNLNNPASDEDEIYVGNIGKAGLLELYQNTNTETYVISKKLTKKIQQAATNYFVHLMNFDWHLFANKCIIQEIDKLMIQKEKKCIWFSSFESSMQGHIPQSGPSCNRPLRDISFNETFQPLNVEHMGDPRKCHMNEENNRIFARLITDIFDSGDLMARDIKMEDYFDVNEWKK